MEYLLDNPESERIYQEILRKLTALQNGVTVRSMTERGVHYTHNLGASVVSLQQLAKQYPADHLLALKLWNKQWRETMILATLLENPDEVSENQIDFWMKQIRHTEIAEQAVMNLFSRTPFAYRKAEEYCLSRKTIGKITGLLMIGRLALTDKQADNEIFESLLTFFPPLAKDAQLSTVFRRVIIQVAMRNLAMCEVALGHARMLLTHNSQIARENALWLIEQLESEAVRELAATRG